MEQGDSEPTKKKPAPKKKQAPKKAEPPKKEPPPKKGSSSPKKKGGFAVPGAFPTQKGTVPKGATQKGGSQKQPVVKVIRPPQRLPNPKVFKPPCIVILGPDGKPLPPSRSRYLCDRIKSTMEEVVLNPSILRKGKVLELKKSKFKQMCEPPKPKGKKGDEENKENECISPIGGRSNLPMVTVKTPYQREIECITPHMCNICWVNDHSYALNHKRLEEDIPYTGGCMHYVPCRHYRHLGDQKSTVLCKFEYQKSWINKLASKYFKDSRSCSARSLVKDSDLATDSDSMEYSEEEELQLMEDDEGNLVAVPSKSDNQVCYCCIKL